MITCTIIKSGRTDEYGRVLNVNSTYTGNFYFVRDLVNSGYATVSDRSVFDDDFTHDNSSIALFDRDSYGNVIGLLDGDTPVALGGGTSLNAPSGFGDFSINNAILIACGDSTTENMQATGGAADRWKALRQTGGILSSIAGMINFGGSGETISGFVTGAIDTLPPVTLGAEVGINQWDSWFHKPTGAVTQATSIAWRNQYTNDVIWSICYGINDLILYSTGTLTQDAITTYIVGYLRTAIEAFQTNNPKDLILLRIPNPMTARPYTGVIPLPAVYPTFGSNLPTDAALVDKWNQALRAAYITVQGEYPRTVLMDTWRYVFGDSTPSLTAATQLPYMGDLVHPGSLGVKQLSELYTKTLLTINTLPVPRSDEAERRAALNAQNPWDNSTYYFRDTPIKYELLVNTTLGNIGAAYMDIDLTIDVFNSVAGSQQRTGGIYITAEGSAAQYYPTYTASNQGGTQVRFGSITNTAAMQAIPLQTQLQIYCAKTPQRQLSFDGYVEGLASTYKNGIPFTISGGGVGYFDVNIDGQSHFSPGFLDSIRSANCAVGGSIQTNFTLVGITITMQGVPSGRTVRVWQPTIDHATWVNLKGAFLINFDNPGPEAFENKKLTGTTHATPGTGTTFAHGLAYTPTRVILTSRGAGYVYESAAADGTNITVASGSASIAFDAYVY